MGIIKDLQGKFQELCQKNGERHRDEAYERKKQQILEQKKELREALDHLETTAQQMDQVVKDFKKAKK